MLDNLIRNRLALQKGYSLRLPAFRGVTHVLVVFGDIARFSDSKFYPIPIIRSNKPYRLNIKVVMVPELIVFVRQFGSGLKLELVVFNKHD